MSLEWSKGWLVEGMYLSYILDNVTYYEYIVARDFAHYVYTWPESIDPYSESGPYIVEKLLITLGYNREANKNYIWQVIFGLDGQVYLYIELPTDIHRHGLPKAPKPSRDLREVSHFEEWMSPYHEPSFITEHFLMRPGYDRMCLSAYNPNDISITPRIRFMVNKMVTERVGVVRNGRLEPTEGRFAETLEKLHKHVIPCRPVTLSPVSMPAREE